MMGRRKGIQSVEIGLGLLDALAGLGRPSSMSEIARASGLSPSQAHRYLASFVNAGYLRQDAGTALYDLDAGALRLGLAALARLDMVEEASRAAAGFIAATGRTVLLAVWADLGPTIIRWHPGTPPIYTTLAIGSRLSLTGSATGRVFLAFQEEGFLAGQLARERAADVEALRRAVRRDCLAGVDGTIIPGLRALAAPVFDLQGRLVLAMTAIASQQFAAADDAAVAARLVATARDVTGRLGGSWPSP